MALDNIKEDDDRHAKCLNIRSSIENIVHALLRVSTMNKRLPEVFKPVAIEKEKERTGSGALPEEGNTFMPFRIRGCMSTALQFIERKSIGSLNWKLMAFYSLKFSDIKEKQIIALH